MFYFKEISDVKVLHICGLKLSVVLRVAVQDPDFKWYLLRSLKDLLGPNCRRQSIWTFIANKQYSTEYISRPVNNRLLDKTARSKYEWIDQAECGQDLADGGWELPSVDEI
jgi:hypothetical protein